MLNYKSFQTLEKITSTTCIEGAAFYSVIWKDRFSGDTKTTIESQKFLKNHVQNFQKKKMEFEHSTKLEQLQKKIQLEEKRLTQKVSKSTLRPKVFPSKQVCKKSCKRQSFENNRKDYSSDDSCLSSQNGEFKQFQPEIRKKLPLEKPKIQNRNEILTVEHMLEKPRDNELWFLVRVGGIAKPIKRSQLVEKNVMALVEYYEKNIIFQKL